MSSTTVFLTDQTEPEPENSILVSKVPTANPVQKTPQLYSTVNSANKKVTIWPLGTTVHRLPVYELEKQLKKMKPSQVNSICLDLAAQLRTLELQFEKVKKQPAHSGLKFEKKCNFEIAAQFAESIPSAHSGPENFTKSGQKNSRYQIDQKNFFMKLHFWQF